MKLLIIATLFILKANFVFFAQTLNFNSQKNWSLHKKEVIFGVGATQFLGDLGGTNNAGKDYSLKDIDIRSTSYNLTLGFRYRFRPMFATTSSLNFGQYKASDHLTDNSGRGPREIDIKSTLITFYQRFEFIFFSEEKVGKRLRLPDLKGIKDKNKQAYIFGGVGLAYYSPQGGPRTKYEGVFLRPLRTEGQGLPGGAEPYKSTTLIIPAGFGYRFGISKMWRMTIEATYFKTFTDYMDDVSTVYYNHELNGQTTSPETVYFSNPSENWNLFRNGDKRGEKEKDAFFYFNVCFAKNVTYKNYLRKNYQWKGVRAKF